MAFQQTAGVPARSHRGVGMGRAGERRREKAAFKWSPRVVPAGAWDRIAQASQVQRQGRSLPGGGEEQGQSPALFTVLS